MMSADDVAAFAFVEAVREGRMDRHLTPALAEIRQRLRLTDRSKPPPKTPEMIASGHQVWVWMWDTPQPAPGEGQSDPDAPGHWEIRGTGARLDEASPMIPDEVREPSLADLSMTAEDRERVYRDALRVAEHERDEARAALEAAQAENQRLRREQSIDQHFDAKQRTLTEDCIEDIRQLEAERDLLAQQVEAVGARCDAADRKPTGPVVVGKWIDADEIRAALASADEPTTTGQRARGEEGEKE